MQNFCGIQYLSNCSPKNQHPICLVPLIKSWLNSKPFNITAKDFHTQAYFSKHVMYWSTYKHKCLNNTSKVFLLGGGSWSINFSNNFKHCSSVEPADSVQNLHYSKICTINWHTYCVLCKIFIVYLSYTLCMWKFSRDAIFFQQKEAAT